jgi:hypothetical protein
VLFRLIQPLLDNFQVVITKILPEIIIYLMTGQTDFILLQLPSGSSGGLSAAFDDPAVNGQQRCLVIYRLKIL